MAKLEQHTSKIISYSKTMKDIIKKFRVGDYITDLEVRQLLTHYMDMEKYLYAEGERYHLPWKEASENVRRLIDMQNARRKNE